MKVAVLLALLTTAFALAEDVAVETSTSKTAAEANRAQKAKLDTEGKPKKSLEESPVTYSGFFVELSRAEKKSRFLSLRQARDPKNDYKNIVLHDRTDRPKGFLLFSLDF